MPIAEQKTYCMMMTKAQSSQEFNITFVGSVNMELFTDVRYHIKFHLIKFCN